MKQWRVGTVSMGASLILFGSALLASQWAGHDAFAVLLDWWPVIFILLGIEVLLYLGLSRKEQPVVKYDIFSIFFVGALCIICLGAAMMSSVGLLQEVRHAIAATEVTGDLNPVSMPAGEAVKKVVILNDNGYPVRVGTSSEASVRVFGSYRTVAYDEEASPFAAEPVSLETVGDTLYVRVLPAARRLGLSRGYTEWMVTVIVPEHVETTIYGNHRMM